MKTYILIAIFLIAIGIAAFGYQRITYTTREKVVDRLHTEFTKALAAPDVREKMLNLGAEPVGSTPEAFAAYVKAEAAKYAKLVKTSGAKVD